MNRLVLLLALAATGTGCVVSDTCDQTVSLGWPSFQLANGAVTPSCATAGVASVDVWMDGNGFVGNFACNAGGVDVTSVHSGSHLFTVEGLDASNNVVLRDEIYAGAGVCNATVIADTEPAEGTFNLAYSFSPSNVCTTGGSWIWFSVYDKILGKVTAAVDEASANPALYVCGSTISFVLPKGDFTLQRTEEVTYNGQYHASAVNCAGADFSIAGAAVTDVPAVMVDSTTFCP